MTIDGVFFLFDSPVGVSKVRVFFFLNLEKRKSVVHIFIDRKEFSSSII